MLSWRSIHPPKSGCMRCPEAKGKKRFSTISPMVGKAEPDPACLERTRLAANGVTKMPIMLEAVALQIAAGTLPFAMAVKATEDWTVDGSVQRNRIPA